MIPEFKSQPIQTKSTDTKTIAKEIGAALQSAAQTGFSFYRPIANQILSDRISSPREIEYILDHMLDYCYDVEMLLMYKQICRYLIHKHPDLAYNAVMNYKDVWDDNRGDSD